MSIKSISSAFHLSRNTVRKYVRRYQESGLTLDQLMTMSEEKLQEMFLDNQNRSRKPSARMDELEALIPDYVKRLSRKGVTVKSLHEEYLREHPDGYKYSTFKRAVRRQKYHVRVVGHVDHLAGDQMYIDYAGDKLEIVDAETGEVRSVEVFVAILPCSHYTYCEAVWSQKKEDLIVACENALRFFGGAPMAIVPDNLKAAVTRSDRNEPVINEDFAAMAEFYDMAVFPARARHPKDKALVENAVSRRLTRTYAAGNTTQTYQVTKKKMTMETTNSKTAPIVQEKDQNQVTLDLMRRMRLTGMANAFEESLTSTYAEAMTPDGFISWLMAREWDYRSSAAIDRLIRGASFRYNAYPEEIDYSISRGLNQNQMERLLSLDFVRQGQNLFITGSAGTGKSSLATAIGYHACKNGIRTLYSNTSKLLSSLKVAKAKNTIETEPKKIERCQLLILDDAFLVPLDAKERPILLEIIEDRHDRKSIVMASQLPVENWYDAIGDQAVADAVLDRIVHSSHRIELFGESIRKMKAKK